MKAIFHGPRPDSRIRCRVRRCGFTLVELLVVVAIIALLLSILMPSLSKAREAARAVICANNHRTMLLATVLYTEDNEGRLPPVYAQFSSGNAWGEYSWNGVARDGAWLTWYSERFVGQYFGNKNPCSTAFDTPQQRPSTKAAYCPSRLLLPLAGGTLDIGIGFNNSRQNNFRTGGYWSGYDKKLRLPQFTRPSSTFLLMDVEGSSQYQWCRFYQAQTGGITGDDNANNGYTSYRHLDNTVVGFADTSVRQYSDALAAYQQHEIEVRADAN